MGGFGQSITLLFLKDHSLTLDELKVGLESFPSHRLKKLSIFVRLLMSGNELETMIKEAQEEIDEELGKAN